MVRHKGMFCWDLDGRLLHHWATPADAGEELDLTGERVRQKAAGHHVWRGMLFTQSGDTVTDILLKVHGGCTPANAPKSAEGGETKQL